MLKRCAGNDRLPNTIVIQRAIMSFISRYLSAELDCKIPICTYIFNQDFWNVSVSTEMLDELMNVFTNKLLIEDSVSLYTTLPKNPIEIRPSKIINKSKVCKSSNQKGRVSKFKDQSKRLI
jgi:hypothetical protein